MSKSVEVLVRWAGEMSEQLRTLAALSNLKDDSGLRTPVVAHNHLWLKCNGIRHTLWIFSAPGTHMVLIYKCLQNRHARKMKTNSYFFKKKWCDSDNIFKEDPVEFINKAECSNKKTNKQTWKQFFEPMQIVWLSC